MVFDAVTIVRGSLETARIPAKEGILAPADAD